MFMNYRKIYILRMIIIQNVPFRFEQNILYIAFKYTYTYSAFIRMLKITVSCKIQNRLKTLEY